ncbi:hypothetical protein PDY_07110 [Photobacterium damselae subsp. damselae]|uniref:glycosyltransferase family 2 protein n=1 Tax=Photobacterium damselae TaxID=38293 RepID=UPI00220789D3|nr:glycosyltransferase [Photobacterium damselae]BDR33663.1 hypothetical protein PDY_07110 [Photobacterium damselae subsp. damselae]
MKIDKKISVGILTYMRVDDIRNTISDLLSSNVDNIELIIVDNNQKSMKYDIFLNLNIPRSWSVIYDHDGINKGVAGGRNRIIELASSDNVIFLDDDVQIDDFQSIIDSCNTELNGNVGILAFKILDIKTNTINKYEFPHKNKELMDCNKAFYTYYFVGAGHAISKKCLSSIGGYRYDLGLYGMEEVDLSYRAISNNYAIKYIPDIKIIHKRSPDGRFSNKTTMYNAFNNKIQIAARHLKFRYFVSHLFAWSFQYIRKTKSIDGVFFVLKNAVKARFSNDRFERNFYDYCCSVKAWLWW